jgi:NAD(P)-dependent dehydrogenase (short-subunit alcohol dehydrogenase family)/acyl carrier protein
VEHVFDSRTLDFVAEIRARTAGRGVDLVLNSLAGDFIPASFSVLDRRGRFLEIGKAGIWTQEQARASHPEVQYHVINLSQDYATRPEVIRPMLSDLVESVARGELALLPLQTFPLSNAVEAFRLMAQARHVGKVVLTQPWTFTEPVSIRPDATYLVTGGLSGLGLAVAGWLAARGARHLLLMGRRAPNANAAATIATLEGRGVRVVSLAGDVSTESDVLGIGAAVRDNNFPRLAGVVHAAGALDDGIIESQSIERYARVFAAKTDGSWLLERACGAESLDFFIAFSSVAAVFGSAGQTNHAAANAYMDLLTARMREAGQPAMSIQWGAWSQIGAAAGADLSERLQQRGLGQLSPAEGLAALEEILGRAFDQVAVVSADWSRFARQLPPPARRYFGALIDTRQTREEVLVGIRPITGEPAQRTLVELLRQAPVAQRRGLLQEAIRANACKVLSLPAAYPIDAKAPLAGLGLDSLMAVELRNLLGRSVGRNLPATLLFDYPTLQALAGWLMTTLELEPVAPIAAVKIEVSDHDLLGSVESLSEAELDVLLKAKLGTR